VVVQAVVILLLVETVDQVAVEVMLESQEEQAHQVRVLQVVLLEVIQAAQVVEQAKLVNHLQAQVALIQEQVVQELRHPYQVLA
jgi:hypothetical protein